MNQQHKGQRVIACDLDGTLAEYDGFKGVGVIGKPIPAIVAAVKQAIAEGVEVWIFTARVSVGDDSAKDCIETMQSMFAIANWCQQVFGTMLPITHEKSRRFTEFWDDRGKQVIQNQGLFVEDLLVEAMEGLNGNSTENLSGSHQGQSRQPAQVRQDDRTQQAEGGTPNR